MYNAFVFCLKKQDIVLKKGLVDFNFITLIHSNVYTHIALVIENYIYKTPVLIWTCHILYSENYHQFFKH